MFRSATVKLTLYYLAIITVICLTFSVVLYHFASQELHRGLYGQSHRIVQEFPGFDFDPALRTRLEYASGAHRLIENLCYFNVVVLVVAGFASYALARRTLEPIQEAHEQQKRFTADVSHELRTPLTALKMTSEVALMNGMASKAELREALTSNLDDVSRLEQLINNLLRLTRLDGQEVTQTFVPVQLQSVVQAAVKTVKPRASEHAIHIETKVPLTTRVIGDSDSLVQLLVIFLDNAIKYSPKDSSITITAVGDNLVNLTIADQGIGIDELALPHIFDRFYRADSARTRTDTSSFGLGLSIAKLIADVHGANIQIASKPNHGTTVTVSLVAPLKPKA